MERAFVYGDLLFESMLFENGRLLNADLHYQRLVNSSTILKFNLPVSFDLNYFQKIIHEAIPLNLFTKKIRIRFTVYRSAKGFYLPVEQEVRWDVELFEIPANAIQAKKSAGIYTEHYKSFHSLSNIKSGNALVYVLASMYAQEKKWDDVFILNEAGRVCEASASNFFWVKDDIWFTPPLSEACVAGVKRAEILQKREVIELECEIEDLENADEIYLSNAIQGLVKLNQLILD
ncbi:MAG: aminotransferase class IV [Bacteroidia bacterium]